MPALIDFECGGCGFRTEGFRGEQLSCPECSEAMRELFSPCTNFKFACHMGLDPKVELPPINNPVVKAELGLEEGSGLRTTSDSQMLALREQFKKDPNNPSFTKEVMEMSQKNAKERMNGMANS